MNEVSTFIQEASKSIFTPINSGENNSKLHTDKVAPILGDQTIDSTLHPHGTQYTHWQ